MKCSLFPFFFLLAIRWGGGISGRVRALNLTVPLGSGRVGSDNLGYGPGSGFSFEPVQTSSVLQTVQKNNRQFTYGQTVQKKQQQFTYGQTEQKTTAIYIWTVHIYRLYRRQCAKYTYISSVILLLFYWIFIITGWLFSHTEATQLRSNTL